MVYRTGALVDPVRRSPKFTLSTGSDRPVALVRRSAGGVTAASVPGHHLTAKYPAAISDARRTSPIAIRFNEGLRDVGLAARIRAWPRAGVTSFSSALIKSVRSASHLVSRSSMDWRLVSSAMSAGSMDDDGNAAFWTRTGMTRIFLRSAVAIS